MKKKTELIHKAQNNEKEKKNECIPTINEQPSKARNSTPHFEIQR